jgi:zinc transporter ZupT
MPTTYVAVLLLSVLSVVTTCLGVLLAVSIRENDKAIAVGIGFSTGIMILISGLELIPEAYVGFLVALAIALHNLPEELALALPAMTFRSKSS